jgi:hypothetical protein
MALEMLIPHPADIDMYLEVFLLAMPALRTFECMFTDAKHPHDQLPQCITAKSSPPTPKTVGATAETSPPMTANG